MAHLGLARGPAELSRVALNALLQMLGDDASLTPGHEANPDSGNLVFAQRDGIAWLAVRVLDEQVSGRVLAVLDQWAAAERPPRALIIDLSRCEEAAPDAAAKLVHQLAPGRVAFSLRVRDEKTGKPQHHVFGKTAGQRNAFDADAQWSGAAYAATPVFVVVSEHTASLAEAAAHALREHRAALVLGLPTVGDGHLSAWFELPEHARFAFTIGDVLGVDGEPLQGKPVVPDACRHGAELVAITPRTIEQARTSCDSVLPTQDEAIAYARRALGAEAPDGAPGATSAGPATAP